jgi:hypothetical protein
LGSSPPPSLGSSPLPSLGSSPHLPGTLGLITGASAGEQTLGGHSRPKAERTTRRRGDGGAPRRRRRAAFSRFDLPQLLLLNSTCELARAAGVGVLSGGVCERARREISFARARWVVALFHVISGAAPDCLCRTASGGGRAGSRFESGPFGSRIETRVEGCFAVANASGVSACVCACAAARRGAGAGAGAGAGKARRAAAARGRSFCPGEAWRARRVVMTPHAEKLLVTHRGGSEPKQATCRMTG